MARCCLNDLDGITSLQSLEELYVAYNEISDLSALSMLENLQLLDLERYYFQSNHFFFYSYFSLFSNLVDDLRQVEFLALCPSLTTLTLEGNPV
jgi:Leucine-rich repeat (LRR) protein